ncbi:MAG: hypothetical protein R3176_04875 [Woeseiaceae bacterium]|nr:hypothetical protein [Woeseiaceae bacterium]
MTVIARLLILSGAALVSLPAVAEELRPVAPAHDAGTRAATIAELEFRDATTLDRLRRFRNLSLVTIAKGRRARLYLGINKDGLAGLHLALRRPGDDARYLELARLR